MTSAFDIARLGWLALAVAACSSSSASGGSGLTGGDQDDDISGGQTGEENYGCLPVERESLALSDRSSLGFSGAEVLAALGSSQRRTLSYDAGGATPLTLGLEYEDGSVAFVQREFRSDGSGREASMEIAVDCGDVVELAVTLTFATDDGAFDEAWPVTLVADTAVTARLFHTFDPEMLAGTFRVARDGADDVSAALSINLTGMTWTGYLSRQREDRQGGPANPDSAVSSTGFDIARF